MPPHCSFQMGAIRTNTVNVQQISELSRVLVLMTYMVPLNIYIYSSLVLKSFHIFNGELSCNSESFLTAEYNYFSFITVSADNSIGSKIAVPIPDS